MWFQLFRDFINNGFHESTLGYSKATNEILWSGNVVYGNSVIPFKIDSITDIYAGIGDGTIDVKEVGRLLSPQINKHKIKSEKDNVRVGLRIVSIRNDL